MLFRKPSSALETQNKLHEIDGLLTGLLTLAVQDQAFAEKRERLRQLSGQCILGMKAFGGKDKFSRTPALDAWLKLAYKKRATILEEGILTEEDLEVVRRPPKKELNVMKGGAAPTDVAKERVPGDVGRSGEQTGALKVAAQAAGIEREGLPMPSGGDCRSGADIREIRKRQEGAGTQPAQLNLSEQKGAGGTACKGSPASAAKTKETVEPPSAGGAGGGADVSRSVDAGAGRRGEADARWRAEAGEAGQDLSSSTATEADAANSRVLDGRGEDPMREVEEAAKRRSNQRAPEESTYACGGGENCQDPAIQRGYLEARGSGSGARPMLGPGRAGGAFEPYTLSSPSETSLKRKAHASWPANQLETGGSDFKRARVQDGAGSGVERHGSGQGAQEGRGGRGVGVVQGAEAPRGETDLDSTKEGEAREQEQEDEGESQEAKERKTIGPPAGLYHVPCGRCAKAARLCEYITLGAACHKCRALHRGCNAMKGATGTPYPASGEQVAGADGAVVGEEGGGAPRGEADDGGGDLAGESSATSQDAHTRTKQGGEWASEHRGSGAESPKGKGGRNAGIKPRPRPVTREESRFPLVSRPQAAGSGSANYMASPLEQSTTHTPEVSGDQPMSHAALPAPSAEAIVGASQTTHDDEAMDVDRPIANSEPGPLTLTAVPPPRSGRGLEGLESQQAHALGGRKLAKEGSPSQTAPSLSSQPRVHFPPPIAHPMQRNVAAGFPLLPTQQSPLWSHESRASPELAQEVVPSAVEQEVIRICKRQEEIGGRVAELGADVSAALREAVKVPQIEREVGELKADCDEANQALEGVKKAQETAKQGIEQFTQSYTESASLISAKLKAHDAKLDEHKDAANARAKEAENLARQVNEQAAVNEERYQGLSGEISRTRGEAREFQEAKKAVTEIAASLKSSICNTSSASEVRLRDQIGRVELRVEESIVEAAACKEALGRVASTLDQANLDRAADWERVKAMHEEDTEIFQRALSNLQGSLERESRKRSDELRQCLRDLLARVVALESEAQAFKKSAGASILEIAAGVNRLLSESARGGPPQPSEPLAQAAVFPPAIPRSPSASPPSFPALVPSASSPARFCAKVDCDAPLTASGSASVRPPSVPVSSNGPPPILAQPPPAPHPPAPPSMHTSLDGAPHSFSEQTPGRTSRRVIPPIDTSGVASAASSPLSSAPGSHPSTPQGQQPYAIPPQTLPKTGLGQRCGAQGSLGRDFPSQECGVGRMTRSRFRAQGRDGTS